MSYGPNDFKMPVCAICGKEVQAKDKVLVERRTCIIASKNNL